MRDKGVNFFPLTAAGAEAGPRRSEVGMGGGSPY